MNEMKVFCNSPEQIPTALENVLKLLNNQSWESTTGRVQGYEITIEPINTRKRTPSQNNALHLWLGWCATHLNNAGYDQREVLDPGMPIPWSPTAFKERVWRPVQVAVTGKTSSTQPTRMEYQDIEAAVRRGILERVGVDLPPWPTLGGG